jgi:hypothetical protein
MPVPVTPAATPRAPPIGDLTSALASAASFLTPWKIFLVATKMKKKLHVNRKRLTERTFCEWKRSRKRLRFAEQ